MELRRLKPPADRLLALGDWRWVVRGQLTMEDIRDFDRHAVHGFDPQHHLIEPWHGTVLRFQLGDQRSRERRVGKRANRTYSARNLIRRQIQNVAFAVQSWNVADECEGVLGSFRRARRLI